MTAELLSEHPVLCSAATAWGLVWLYTYFTCGRCRSKARMDGKTVIVTGSSAGIGKCTAMDLARRGARVIMACRNLEKATAVRDSIVSATNNTNVVVRLLNLRSMSSVRQFAEETLRSEARLDVLIHNAAIDGTRKEFTREGLNPMWATNHFGPFLLTHLLIDLLKRTEKSRIVVVSSYLHRYGYVDLKNPNPPNKPGAKVYASTKFANILFTVELARRLEGSGVTANSLHPGAIITKIWDNIPAWMMPYKFICRPFFKTEEQGAQTTVYLAVSEEVDGISGKYFSDCKMSTPLKETSDENLAKSYWEICETLVQLKPSDPRI